MDTIKKIDTIDNNVNPNSSVVDDKNKKVQFKTFRYNFSQQFIEEINNFIVIHKFSDRKTYKEKWDEWFVKNQDIIKREKQYMINLGYNGDINDKMFTAGRYYFRKKCIKSQIIENKKEQPQEQPQQEQPQQKPQQQKRNYITIGTETLKAIDEHIQNKLNNSYKNDKNIYSETEFKHGFKPEDGFNHFYKNNTNLIDTEIKSIMNKSKDITPKIDLSFINKKIKKTYKNRYYIASKLIN